VPETAGVKVARSKPVGKVTLITPWVTIVVAVVKPMVTEPSTLVTSDAGVTLVLARAAA
jgi:hypothetical protein